MSLRLTAALPATGILFTGWLLWELDGQWDRLGTTNQVLAALLVLAALGFSGVACTTLHEALAARPTVPLDTEHNEAPPDGAPDLP